MRRQGGNPTSSERLRRSVRPALLAASAAVALLAVAPPDAGSVGSSFPAAGRLVSEHAVARAAPDPAARRVLVLHQFRRDYRPQIVLATGRRVGADGREWYRLNLPMRPNGTTGWIPAAKAAVEPVPMRIVIRRDARRIEVWRGSKLLVRSVVAVGAPGMETPLGRFYVTARFFPRNSFLGIFALETSAYSRLSEWPGGGVVGIHGTSRPDLLGQAVSHGCVRVSNATAARLRDLVAVGTPISIVP